MDDYPEYNHVKFKDAGTIKVSFHIPDSNLTPLDRNRRGQRHVNEKITPVIR
jgi:hypothetical protein